MQQQVNLAKFVTIPIKSPLDAKRLLFLYGVVLGFLMIIYLCFLLIKYYHQSELYALKIQLESVRKELLFNATKYPQSSISIKLLDTQHLPTCGTKFSTDMIGFAKAATPGAWLTEINIADKGRQINLKGHALQASQAQQYLMQLEQLPEFANFTFELTELTQVADLINTKSPANQALNFQLTAKAGNSS